MKRILILVLCWAGVVSADTLPQFMNAVRMLTLDRGTPRLFVDSVYHHYGVHALQYVGTRSLSVVVDTTITLTPGTVTYTLNRVPLKMVMAYSVAQSGAVSALPRLPHDEIWKSNQEQDFGYSVGPDRTVFITKKLSYEYKIVLHYVTTPIALAKDSATAIDLPNGLLSALYYQSAADALDATRIPTNVAAAAKLSARAEALIGIFMAVNRGEQLDSAAIK